MNLLTAACDTDNWGLTAATRIIDGVANLGELLLRKVLLTRDIAGLPLVAARASEPVVRGEQTLQ
jgi:hypothetical protein